MENKAIRRARLKMLIDRYAVEKKGQRHLAEDTGSNVSHLSQLMTGNRQMGDEVARRIEERLNLGRGWMDKPIDGTPEPEPTFRLSVAEKTLLMLFRDCDQSGQEFVMEAAHAAAMRSRKPRD